MKPKKKLQIENESTIENQTRVFIESIKTVDEATPLHSVLYQHYCDVNEKGSRIRAYLHT